MSQQKLSVLLWWSTKAFSVSCVFDASTILISNSSAYWVTEGFLSSAVLGDTQLVEFRAFAFEVFFWVGRPLHVDNSVLGCLNLLRCWLRLLSAYIAVGVDIHMLISHAAEFTSPIIQGCYECEPGHSPHSQESGAGRSMEFHSRLLHKDWLT